MIFFTTDGTKPDPFQKGRTGRCSTNKYIGPFRLQLGKRVVRAIVTSRDRLRESPVSTKYIDVTIEPPSPDENSSFSDPEELAPVVHEVIEEFPGPIPFIRRSNSELGFHRVIHPVPMMPPPPPPQTDFEGHIEGPINPVNYHGTQINVWGIPPPNLGGFLDPRRQIQQPQPPVQSKPEEPPKNECKFTNSQNSLEVNNSFKLFQYIILQYQVCQKACESFSNKYNVYMKEIRTFNQAWTLLLRMDK